MVVVSPVRSTDEDGGVSGDSLTIVDNWNFGPVSNEVGLRFTVPVRELGESQSVDFTRTDLREVGEALAKED